MLMKIAEETIKLSLFENGEATVEEKTALTSSMKLNLRVIKYCQSYRMEMMGAGDGVKIDLKKL